jgi:hypothetical protein
VDTESTGADASTTAASVRERKKGAKRKKGAITDSLSVMSRLFRQTLGNIDHRGDG